MSFFTPGYAPLWVHFLTDTFSLLIPAWYYSRIYKKVNSSESSVSQKTILLIGAAAGALIGSRLIAVLERPGNIIANIILTLFVVAIIGIGGCAIIFSLGLNNL